MKRLAMKNMPRIAITSFLAAFMLAGCVAGEEDEGLQSMPETGEEDVGEAQDALTVSNSFLETGPAETELAASTASTLSVTHIGSSYMTQSLGDKMDISRPAATLKGDLMILAIQTATGVVPTAADGTGDWIPFKRCAVDYNEDGTCNSAAADDDLGISLFYNYAGTGGAKVYRINKPSGQFTAAHLSVVRNVAPSNPIQNVKQFLDNGKETEAGDGLDTKTTCKALPVLSRGMNMCALAHDDAQKLVTPSGWARRSDAALVTSDSALFLYTRSSNTAVADTTINYDGPDPLGEFGNGINISFQIKPVP